MKCQVEDSLCIVLPALVDAAVDHPVVDLEDEARAHCAVAVAAAALDDLLFLGPNSIGKILA